MTHKNPFLVLAAVSLFWITLLLLSAVRVEAFAGLLPTSNSRSAETTPLAPPNVLSHRTTSLLSLSQKDTNDGLDGASDFELFVPRLLDGIAFNLFGLGRKDDEEASTGAFQPPQDSMTGIVMMITGAASGLGLESAKRLALAGATVIVTDRTPTRTAKAVQAVRNYCLGGPASQKRGAFVNRTPMVRGIALDLADLSSVRSFPERYRTSMLSLSKISNRDETAGKILGNPKTGTQKIHVLLNNACGGSVEKKELTMDGFEMIFQTGYLGHFVLTARLLEEGLLNDEIVTEIDQDNSKGSGCTIISVSSSAHRSSVIYTGDDIQDGQPPKYGFDFENINSDLEFSLNTYSRTKLAHVMFTKELQRRANSTGWLTAVSVDPGVSSTNIWKNSQPADATWKDKILPNLLIQFMTKVERGANAHVWLAYASSVKSTIALTSGQHYDETRNPAPTSRFANDPESNRKLWELSEKMGGIRFDLGTTPMESTGNKDE